MKRLLVVCRHFWPENNKINDLCENLLKYDYKIDVLCGQPSNHKGEFCDGYNSFKIRREIHNKINIYRTIDVKRGNDSNIRIFLNYTFFPVMSLLQTKRLAGNKYDMVLVYQLSPVMMAWAGLRIGKKCGIPVYIYAAKLWPQSLYSTIDVQSSLFKKILSAISMNIYKAADSVIAPSEKVRKYLSDKMVIPKEHIHIVLPSADHFYESETGNETIQEQFTASFNLVIIGDSEGLMSENIIVDLAEMIRKSGIRNIRFIIVGNGNKISELKRLVGNSNLEDYFYFEGYVPPEQISDYLYIADIMLGVLKQDSDYVIPDQTVNYMAAGKPVVMTMQGLVKELIRNSGCGYASEPDDVETLFDNIIKIYNMTPEERNRLGENAREYQQQYFSGNINAESIHRIISGQSTDDMPAPDSTIQKLW